MVVVVIMTVTVVVVVVVVVYMRMRMLMMSSGQLSLQSVLLLEELTLLLQQAMLE